VPRGGVPQASQIKGLWVGATLNFPSVFQEFPREAGALLKTLAGREAISTSERVPTLRSL
jgi:hypothetical protein